MPRPERPGGSSSGEEKVTSARRPPQGKTKLLTLHVDGKVANVGFAEFLHDVLHAVGNRSTRNLEETNNGGPILHVNAGGDLVVYVNDWTV
jgi:hypothetical protein